MYLKTDLDIEKIERDLNGILAETDVRRNVPMREYTAFKVGGNADIFIEPGTLADLFSAFEYLSSSGIPVIIMGRGTNCLFSDSGYRGAILRVGAGNQDVAISGNTVYAQSGAPLSKIASACAKAGLAGFEFAAGIPGSVGGAVYMNAGAYGSEMKDVVISVSSFAPGGKAVDRGLDDLNLSYRSSIFNDKFEIIYGVKLELQAGDPAEIEGRMSELAEERAKKQPLNYPSAGSFFKRPAGNFAGRLIEESGLKGLRIGGAMVSDLHAGFIINVDSATSSDIYDLMRVVQERVLHMHGVMLEPEVKLIGF